MSPAWTWLRKPDKFDRMTRPFTLEIEKPIALAKTHEVAILRQAVAANPGAIKLRRKLAVLLFTQDQFDEAIGLFKGLLAEAPDADIAWFLAEAYLSLETPESDHLSEAAARQSFDLADNGYQRASALAALGKALRRQGHDNDARAVLIAALHENPRDTNAYKRLVALDLERGAYGEILALAEQLLAQGVGHSRLMVARALAHAMQGQIALAREAVGLDQFLLRSMLTPPAGWPSTAALNADVKAELARHPDLRFDRYGTASTETWRIDEPAFPDSTAIAALQGRIREAVLAHVAVLDGQDTLWTRQRPVATQLHNWCVLTDADGFEEWHVHQGGWMSGVYYVDVPEAVTTSNGKGGCIAFGLPENVVGADAAAAFGETLVRPEAGLLMLFPSHAYHRTFAHGSHQRRICLAFDIKAL
jgi:tetratricopeptide (TPR) repeat protein